MPRVSAREYVATSQPSMKTTNSSATEAQDDSAYPPGSVEGGDNKGGSLKEEEKIEEDVIVDRMSEAQSDNISNGKLKTPEDERGDIADTTDADGKMNNESVHQKNEEDATSSSQKGTIAEIPDDKNNNAAQEDAALSDDDANDRNSSVRGVMFVPGPGYTGRGIFTGYHSGPDDDDTNINEGTVILQGFLPEDDPRRRRKSSQEIIEERVQRLIDNAITLDDSAVKPIPLEEDGDEEENIQSQSNSSGNDDEEKSSDKPRWFLPLLGLLAAVCIILAIALPLSLRKTPENEVQDTAVSLSAAGCLPGEVNARFELAKSILSSITSPDVLDDASNPQGKAIRWIVCDDSISVQLLENQDSSTGNLPRQKHGFRFSGDSGEAQVTRRYILATFYFSTSQVSPWKDSLNFLSPDLHECHWHRNYTRKNLIYRDFDPVGVNCVDDVDEVILLDDYQQPVDFMMLNIRIFNDLNGQLPPEFGYLMDCRSIMFENHVSLTGQLPQTMGNMSNLASVALLFNGLGGELPSSLFRLKKLLVIRIIGPLPTAISDNTTQDELNWSLPSNVDVIEDTQLERLVLRNRFGGAFPSWIINLKQLQVLNLQKNKFEGAIPEAIGDLSFLKYVNLLGNKLTDTIPASIGNLTAIEALVLGQNALQGELPASIGNLRRLQLLDVGSNELTSTIPSSFENLESLEHLVLESNRFNGTVEVLESLKNLATLVIRSNSFSGPLPDGLFSVTSDNIRVDVGDNKFTGDLPASFSNMSNLISLVGPKNSFTNSATSEAICDSTNTTVFIMDCDACECCEFCCDGENDAVCDFQLDVRKDKTYLVSAYFPLSLWNFLS